MQLDLGGRSQGGQALVVGGGGVHKHAAVGVQAGAEGNGAQRRLHGRRIARVAQCQGLVGGVPHTCDRAQSRKVQLVARASASDSERHALHSAVQIVQLHQGEQAGWNVSAPVVFSQRGQIADGGRVVGGRHADGGGGHTAVQLAIVHVDAQNPRCGVGAVAQVGEGQAVEQGFIG